jgi:acetyl-CoA C-acetyltransferase
MQALDSAMDSMRAGRSQLVLAGGVDALSRAPLLVSDAMVSWLSKWYAAKGIGKRAALLTELRLGHLAPVIALMRGLTDPIVGLMMGQTAENLAYRFGITRAEMDALAATSHERALAAQREGRLAHEVVPLYDTSAHVYPVDDGVREDSTPANLAKLKPFFDRKYGNVTAGNSSQVTDGAAWLLLATEEAVKRYGFVPKGRIADSQWAALDPAQMGLGPVYATAPILARHGLGIADVDAWEINEAFAAQVLACLKAMASKSFAVEQLDRSEPIGEIDIDRLNVNGGAIALGHPVGATGARLVLTLLLEMRRRDVELGVAALCVGGGQGAAILLERR